MDYKELLKLQMFSQMGSSYNRDSGQHSMYTMFLQMFFMMFLSLLDDIVKQVPKIFNDVKKHILCRFTSKVMDKIESSTSKTLVDTSINLNTRHHINTFVLRRIYNITSNSSSSNSNNQESSNDDANGMVDAVLSYIAKMNNVPSFLLINNGQAMVDYLEKPIQLTKDIFVKIENIVTSDKGSVSSVKLKLLSNTISASEITKFVKSIYDIYLQDIKNSLGNNIYFFDQKSREGAPPPLPMVNDNTAIMNHKRMMISTAPKQLSFTMTPFYSNKRFSNIYGKEVREIEHRVKFFIENRDWYDRKGVPYQLGILLSGIPGAGKTSVIRAIANMTQRHIINVNFANITTASQLKNLFYNERIQVYTDSTMSNTQSYFIPIEQRIYVLEEIDATTNILKQRTPENKQEDILNDELTLGEILTVLDGTMEIPGRIVIMTSNHPELLDKALIRPGRMDLNVYFNNATRDQICEMYEGYLDEPFPEEYKHELPDEILTPAEVGQVLFRHFDEGKKPDFKKVLEDFKSYV